MKKGIGIDLGTYNSAAAFATGREAIMVQSKYGTSLYGKSFPSFVLFDYNGKKQMVGKLAKAEGFRDPKLLVWGVKRLVGLSYNTAKERGELERFKYEIEEGPGGSILIKVGEERYTPSHILEFILKEIKEDAENTRVNPLIGGTIDEAVISVPAYFDGTRVGPIKEAAEKAGFAEVGTIAEPTAAALQYGLKIQKNAKIMAFDQGAGTLDVTIMRFLNEGDELICGELCTAGHEALGGIDMDDALLKYVSGKHGLQHIKNDPSSFSVLRDEVEKAKIRLSSQSTVPVDLPTGQTVSLTREELENVLKPILDKCRGPIRVALEGAQLEASRLDHVLFVGGPTYMQCVRATVKDELKRLGARKELFEELEVFDQKGLPVNPMECVARGASLKAKGIAEPLGTDPNGYGTIVSLKAGEPACFYAIISPNSNYPITKTGQILHGNPLARRVPIGLVKRLTYAENDHTVYKYYHLGNYDCYIRSTGELPKITITMQLTNDKVLITMFTHEQTGESVRFEKLDEMKGNEIVLQEMSPPRDEGSGTHTPPIQVPPRGWTQEQLNKAVHVARMLVDEFAEHSQDVKVTQKKRELCDVMQGANDPRYTPTLHNRISELLNALKNANGISETEFRNYIEELRRIEGSS